jgi:hypothetical protein
MKSALFIQPRARLDVLEQFSYLTSTWWSLKASALFESFTGHVIWKQHWQTKIRHCLPAA